MSEALTLRPATATDVGAITEIYRHYVRTHTATFEIDPPDEAEMTARMRRISSANLPYWVAERLSEVIGYCYVSPYHLRLAYQFTVEDSVYVRPEHVAKGVGAALLARVIAACAERGYREVIAIIGDSDNQPSIKLHRGAGFTHVGTLKNIGFKFDRWLDTVIMQRSLGTR